MVVQATFLFCCRAELAGCTIFIPVQEMFARSEAKSSTLHDII